MTGRFLGRQATNSPRTSLSSWWIPVPEKGSQQIYRDFIERFVHFESLIYEKKKLVMDVLLASDIESLGHMLSDVSERDRLHRDFTLDSLSTVVRELIACFPVYRTYITAESGVSEADRQVILRATRAAKRRNAAIDTSIFDFLRDILLLEKFDQFNDETRQLQLEFVLKFQQCTAQSWPRVWKTPPSIYLTDYPPSTKWEGTRSNSASAWNDFTRKTGQD